eukprot:SAG31_NODE_50365_length_115_cov_58.687500_1_plen_26_part_10
MVTPSGGTGAVPAAGATNSGPRTRPP